MNKTIIAIIVIVVLAILVYFVMFSQPAVPTSPETATTTAPAAIPAPTTPAASQNGTTAKTVTVKIENFAFSPATLTIASGTKVIWINNDPMPHTVTASGVVSSGPIAPGRSFTFIFTKTGTVNYICSIHPSMAGQVIVK